MTFRGVLAALLLATTPAWAGGVPGDFDFYVLSLSWSPTWCATAERPDPTECGKPHGFVVHGLWPQYEDGAPDACPTGMPQWVGRPIVNAIRDIMPAAGLVGYEWRTHGVCSGLSQEAYFATVRRALDEVALPENLTAPRRDATLSPRAIEQAFIAANPRLVDRGIAVVCSRGQLEEVRICLTKSLEFRRCPEVDRRGCRAGEITVPAVR